ncbi:M20/M25/M40 family metallo-hydrolase [bacterium]|nr:M20/M25/M40 family metallo-hydrolase [bacterium]
MQGKEPRARRRTFLWVGTALALALAATAGWMVLRAQSLGGSAAATPFESLPEPPPYDLGLAVDHLSRAVAIQTVTTVAGDPQPSAEGPWLEFHALIDQTYSAISARASFETIAGLTRLYTWQGTDETLAPVILMAHQDVVPVNPGTEKDWSFPPFSGAVAPPPGGGDDHVWGRGAMDDKGSLIAILEAADALARAGWAPNRTIMFLFGHDEEVSGAGAQAAFRLLAEREVKPYLVLDEGFAVLSNFPLTGKPAALIGVAEKGYLSVEITATTEGGHSSRPPRESGAVRIARAISALDENQLPADLTAPPFTEMIDAVAQDLPFATRLAFANRWAFSGLIEGQLTDPSANAIVRTTTAPTMLEGSVKDNVLPQRARAVVNFRIHPRDTIESVLQHVRDVTAHIDGLTIAPYRDGIGSEASPVSSTTGDAWSKLRSVAHAAGGGGDLPVAPGLMIAATDARYASAISTDAVYRFIPAIYDDADLNGFHGTNERLSVANLRRMIDAYAQLMMVTAGG